MTSIGEIVKALNSSVKLTGLLGAGLKSIYHLKIPKVCSYPCICYSLLSERPSLYGDNSKLCSRKILRIHIVTKTNASSYNDITGIIRGIMSKYDWQEQQLVEMLDGPDSSLIVRTLDFVKEKEV